MYTVYICTRVRESNNVKRIYFGINLLFTVFVHTLLGILTAQCFKGSTRKLHLSQNIMLNFRC